MFRRGDLCNTYSCTHNSCRAHRSSVTLCSRFTWSAWRTLWTGLTAFPSRTRRSPRTLGSVFSILSSFTVFTIISRLTGGASRTAWSGRSIGTCGTLFTLGALSANLASCAGGSRLTLNPSGPRRSLVANVTLWTNWAIRTGVSVLTLRALKLDETLSRDIYFSNLKF